MKIEVRYNTRSGNINIIKKSCGTEPQEAQQLYQLLYKLLDGLS